jgi:hypothetical protein
VPQVTALKALAGYFNEKGQGSSVGGSYTIVATNEKVDLPAGVPATKALRDFSLEIKALSDDEKRSLAEGVCAITGDTLTPTV